MDGEAIAEAIKDTLISPNEMDQNWEAANVVDGLFAIARALRHVARAIEGSAQDGTVGRGGGQAAGQGADRQP